MLRPFPAAILAAAILTAVPAAAGASVRISVPPRPRDAAALERIKNRLDSRLPPPAPRAGASPRTAVVSPNNFAGLAAVQNPSFAQDTPPDPTGAMGPDDYIELANSMIAIYPRDTTTPSATNNLQAFIGDNFTPAGTFVQDGGPASRGEDVFDIQVQWDQQANRWLFAAADVSPDAQNHLVYGWSKSNDPALTNWCMYRTSGTTPFDDYPKLGHNNSHLLIGVNRFSKFDGGTFQGAHVWRIPLPLAGTISDCTASPPTPADTALPRGVFTPVPANVTDDAGSATGYVVAAESAPGDLLQIFSVDNTGAVDAAHPKDVTVTSYGVPPNVRQPGTTAVLDSQDGRLTQAVAHADPDHPEVEAIWTQHTVASNDGLRSQVRWYELDPTGSALQTGSVADLSNFVFNGAVSPASDGSSAAVQYNVGGRFHLVDLRAQTRITDTPLNTLRGEITLAASGAVDADFTCTEGLCRWGDYAGASPDPKTGSETVVWGTGQLNGAIRPDQDPSWITQNFAIEDDGADATAPDTTIDQGGFLTNDTTPAFQFASTETGSSFQCSLDGGTFANCTPGSTFGPPLADGGHALEVKATDSSGNTDPSPAHTTFTIDSTPPDTLFDSGPTPAITVNFASFEFHSTEAGSTLQCSFDGGRFTACASPFNATALPLGAHALSVRATDAAGNTDATPAVYGFSVVPVTPPPPAKPSVSVKSQRLARNGRVSLRVSCPAGRSSSCVGTVTLTASVSGKARTVRLGSARFRIATGRATSVRIKLGKSARKLLARKKRLRVKAKFRFSSPATTTTRSFRLSAPKRKG